jgi:hypothetical protein
MDVIGQHETENLANAGYGLQQIQGVGIMQRARQGCQSKEIDIIYRNIEFF